MQPHVTQVQLAGKATYIRGLRAFARNLHTPLGLPLALFFLSGLLGALIAFDPLAAWFRFGLILGGVALFMIVANLPEKIHLARGQDLPLVEISLALFPALLGAYFLLTGDWANRVGKDAWFDPLLNLSALVLPRLPGARLNPNVVGGVLAVFIPLQIAALKWARRDKLFWVSVVLVGLSLSGLLLSELRGAWLALAVVGFVYGLWKLCGELSKRWVREEQARAQFIIWSVLLGLLAIVSLLAVVATPLGSFLLGLRSDRWEVWRNSLDLASDYPFTGLGLGGFELAYSSYVLLLHVGHTAHAHNLFLDLWLQQGLLGLLSFAGLAITAVSRGTSPRWRIAGLAALGVILLHGLVDDAFVGYGGKALPLLFVPLGLLMRQSPRPIARSGHRLKPIIWGAVACLIAVSSFLPSIRSAFFANLGALSQTQMELSVYRWPAWPVQDQVRRSFTGQLAAAVRFYQVATTIDPANATANRRLGQIELSLGQYQAAQQHLLAAYATAPGQRATRQLLGETYAISGETEQAAMLWRSIDVSDGQLGLREWWYEHVGEPEHAELVKEAAKCCLK
jgi:O-Antigen ligase